MKKQNSRLGKQRVCPNHLTTFPSAKDPSWDMKSPN